jgi:hypothetical protein
MEHYCQRFGHGENSNFKSPSSKDGDVLMGKLMINFQGRRHSISGGELGQAFTSAMIAIGNRSELTLQVGIAVRAYIDGRCRISDLTDYTAEPKRRDQVEGNGGRMGDGYGFLFPNLVVEIAVSGFRDSRGDLLADLRTWISDAYFYFYLVFYNSISNSFSSIK